VTVAEKDKKTEGEEKAPEQPRKKGLPAIVMVAAGAVLGGAGVVFGVPQKKPEAVVEQPVLKDVQVQHPDLMEYAFNPRTDAGKAYASIAFYFVYEVREDREQKAFEQIKAHWDRARSNCLLLLKARTLRELNSENGQRILAKDLTDELNASLFPGIERDKMARVTEVLWSKFIIQ
jgi:flagellar basal body-associated protein FliL